MIVQKKMWINRNAPIRYLPSWICHWSYFFNNKWNKWKQINATRQWTQAFCEWNKSTNIKLLCVFTKFVSFGERRRSLKQTIEFVTFVQFVVERKESNYFLEWTTFFNERSAIDDRKTTIIYLWLSIILAYFANNEEIPVHPIYIYMVRSLPVWPAYRLCEDVVAGQATGYWADAATTSRREKIAITPEQASCQTAGTMRLCPSDKWCPTYF